MARNRFDEDELDDRKIDVHIIARLFHWIKPYKKQMLLSCIAMLAASGVSLISPLLIKLAIDKAIPQRNMHMLFGLAALLLCNSVIVWRLLVVKLRLMTRVAQKIIVEIRRDIFAKLQALPFTYFDSRPHGKIQIRVVNYVNSLSDLLSNGIIQLISDLFNIIVILCFMFAIDTRLTLICMAVLPLLLITLLSLKKVQHKAWQQVSYKQSNLNASLSESLNGMKITQSFSRESINMNIFRGLCNEWKKTWMKAVNINNIIWPVIDNLSLKIKPGQYVAIVGATGCGKSTLLRIMLGFEKPQKGAVYYDGKNLENLDLKSLRRKIGVVMQTGGLFQGDIFSNITISAPQLSMNEAWEAAQMAGIAEDIRRMPMGMHTIISEGSGGISGGQKQRLMIARAIAPKPKILMFDEATSALDNLTQKIVSESLDRLKCTRIVIAHRLSTIRHCDRIIVLEKGQIVEDGTYEELIQKNGFFAELVERQRVD